MFSQCYLHVQSWHAHASFHMTSSSCCDGEVVVAFSLLARIGGGGVFEVWWFIPCLCFFFFFFKVEIILHTPIPHFWPGSVHSGSANWSAPLLFFHSYTRYICHNFVIVTNILCDVCVCACAWLFRACKDCEVWFNESVPTCAFFLK